jgi:hypothetical protein
MCEVNEKELNQEIENEQNEYVDSSEEIMGQIAVQEELKRIDIQDNPISEVSQITLESDFYKDSMTKAETIGAMFQKLIGFGLDYNNALSFANIILQNDATLKQQKYIQVAQEQNQI